ncbi:MAG: zinc ABC transporter substrate-binding protein [Natronomonas sp.]
MDLTRRSVLKTGAGGAAVGLSGCLASPFEGDDSSDGYAAFFTLWDWAEQVGGDHFSFVNPVESGEMGHGWSPDGDITRNVASSDVFVYLDSPEWAWAQDIAAELERDYDDVTVIDLLAGLESYLIGFDSETLPEPDYGHEYPPERLRRRFDIFDLRSNDQLGYWHDTREHWHGGVPDVELDSVVPVGVVLRDEDDRVVPLGANEMYHVDARIADGESDDVLEIESRGDYVEFFGQSVGSTAVVFEIRRGEEAVYDTAVDPAPVAVVESTDDDGIDEFYDPHTWVDPVLATEMVETIADELALIDPDHENDYRQNAADYIERIDEVHEAFQTLTANAERDVAVFAGHDSFEYVERRYGFELHTPVAISPDAAESFDDISETIELIETHDIETVLYDPFEAPNPTEDLPQMVEVIFEHTDIEDAEPLSSASGTTAEWDDRGWGWVEQMEELNLPSLRKALGAA